MAFKGCTVNLKLDVTRMCILMDAIESHITELKVRKGLLKARIHPSTMESMLPCDWEKKIAAAEKGIEQAQEMLDEIEYEFE